MADVVQFDVKTDKVIAVSHAKVVDLAQVFCAKLNNTYDRTHQDAVLFKLLEKNLSSQLKGMSWVFVKFKSENSFLSNQGMVDGETEHRVRCSFEVFDVINVMRSDEGIPTSEHFLVCF